MDGGATLTGVRDAARVLGVNPSTISRQLDKFVAAGLVEVQERDGKKLFPLEDYRRAAAQATNPLMARQGGAAIELGLATPPASRAPQAPAAPAAPLATAATAHKAIQAQLLNLELAEKTGRVVSRDAVAAAIQTAARELRDTLQALPARLKGELASMTDPAEIQRALDKAIKDSLAQMAGAFARLGANETPEPETPQS
jgi:DNA-binding MarR family transcriptional regulator